VKHRGWLASWRRNIARSSCFASKLEMSADENVARSLKSARLAGGNQLRNAAVRGYNRSWRLAAAARGWRDQ